MAASKINSNLKKWLFRICWIIINAIWLFSVLRRYQCKQNSTWKQTLWCPPISPNPISPNPYMLVLGTGLGLGLGSGFDYFRQYNVIRRIGIRRNRAEPTL